MSAADRRIEAAAALLEQHLPESVSESGCALRCGYDGDDMAEHLAAALLAALDAVDPLRANTCRCGEMLTRTAAACQLHTGVRLRTAGERMDFEAEFNARLAESTHTERNQP